MKRRVFGYEKIVLNNTKFGERYMLKVETASADETQRVGSIEVMCKACIVCILLKYCIRIVFFCLKNAYFTPTIFIVFYFLYGLN